MQRALSVIATEFDAIQAELYQYSSQMVPRKTGVLYYDCTNFYFETEEDDDISNQEADEKDMPAYTRTELTDVLHETAGFRTDYEITREKAMKGILRKSKKR